MSGPILDGNLRLRLHAQREVRRLPHRGQHQPLPGGKQPFIEEAAAQDDKYLKQKLFTDDAFRLTLDRVLHPFKTVESDTQLPYKFYDFLEEFEVPGY